MNKKNTHSGKARGAKCLVAIIAVLSLFFGQAILTSAADAPQFNIFTPYTHTQQAGHDYFLLDAKNETKGTDWNFPVSADAGDILVFYLYYHNGVNNSVAKNTTLKVSLPGNESTTHTVTGYLWADNALNATPGSPLTQSVQVNLSSSEKLEVLPGSIQWFPNQTDWRTEPAVPFPGGQSADQLFAGGINIGDVEGCWEFSGAIVFKVKVSAIQRIGNLTIEKKMRNLTQNSGWNETVTAAPREQLAARIEITNTGNGLAQNVVFRDNLPDRLIIVPNTLKLDGNPISGNFTTGINIGTLSPGQTKTIYYEVTVEREVKFVRGTTSLVNTAFACADNINEIQDSATVVVGYNGCNYEITIPPIR